MIRLICIALCAALTTGAILETRTVPDAAPPQRIVIGLRADVPLRLEGGMLGAPRALDRRGMDELRTLNAADLRLAPRFDTMVDDDVLTNVDDAAETRLQRWIEVEVPAGLDAEALIDRLSALSIIEHVYLAPRAVPASFGADRQGSEETPNYVKLQGYLDRAPRGLDIEYAWTLNGGNGAGVTISDIEGDWNKKHEDLRLDHKRVFGERAGKRSTWYEHGTAVIGILGGRRNGRGVTGIAWGARIRLYSIFRRTQESGFVDNVADAIYQAARRSRAGDIILLEVQYSGLKHANDYIPVEYYPDVFEAILFATGRGIIVVEAAGNGGQNLDDPMYHDRFNADVRGDSGAIMVGAGSASGDNSAASLSRDRKRLWFSNFGTRVDVQNWGERVVSTGYGDLLYGGHRRTYTAHFNGTSSASAITAGACAVIQGVALKQLGRPLSPAEMRNLLVKTGSPQQGNDNNRSIGPRPNLKRALRTVQRLPG